MVSVSKLREVLNYNPETGEFTWRTRHVKKVWPGKKAGYFVRGYGRISVDGKKMWMHRIAWAMHYGEHPPEGMVIDHINRDRGDNRISNLRLVPHHENTWNCEAKATSVTGLKGVSPEKHGRWCARIRVAGKRVYIGAYDTPEEAAEAYRRYEAVRAAKPDFYAPV